jgi:acetylornithine deacetylase/succinyl-diaminopimelate desuccinylase-like protein
VLVTDREGADAYRARCRKAASRGSLGGPRGAISYLAATQYDGSPVINGSGTASNITRTYVSQDSTTGIVDAYYASATGPATSDDVTAANLNIQSYAYATPDAITFTGAAAIATPITVSGTVKIRARPGLVVATVKQAIVDTLTAYFATLEIGGVDQVAGAGVVYTADLVAVVRTAYSGIYDPVLSAPVAVSTAIALGHVATLVTSTASWTVTVVP